MYYLYKRSKKATLPAFDYTFNNFRDFYVVANILSIPWRGAYYIRVKCDDVKDILEFMKIKEQYSVLEIYIEVNDSLLQYVQLRLPGISLLNVEPDFEVFKRLIEKHNILFDKNCHKKVYFSIEHSYAEMDEALSLIKATFPDKRIITEKEITQLFVIDNLVYPRSVCIAYLRLEYGRLNRLRKCVETFGNDLCFYAMRKTARNLLKDKIKYLRSGSGPYIVKVIPVDNIVRMLRCLDYNRERFLEVETILKLYEKGGTIDDIVQKRTYHYPD